MSFSKSVRILGSKNKSDVLFLGKNSSIKMPGRERGIIDEYYAFIDELREYKRSGFPDVTVDKLTDYLETYLHLCIGISKFR